MDILTNRREEHIMKNKDPIDLAEQRRDLEEMGLNKPVELDEDTEYERWVDRTRQEDINDVIKIFKTMHEEPITDTVTQLVILIDKARRGR